MDEAHDRRALADRGRAALDRAGAHVAGRVDAGHARLEQALGAGVGAGEDEAVRVARDDVAEPVGAGRGAEEEEEEGERQPVAVGERDRLEPAVLAVQRGDFAAVADRDAVAVELVDQVARTSSRARSARRCRSVTRAPPRASQTAAWAAELPPPTTPTRWAPQSCASGGPAA